MKNSTKLLLAGAAVAVVLYATKKKGGLGDNILAEDYTLDGFKRLRQRTGNAVAVPGRKFFGRRRGLRGYDDTLRPSPNDGEWLTVEDLDEKAPGLSGRRKLRRAVKKATNVVKKVAKVAVQPVVAAHVKAFKSVVKRVVRPSGAVEEVTEQVPVESQPPQPAGPPASVYDPRPSTSGAPAPSSDAPPVPVVSAPQTPPTPEPAPEQPTTKPSTGVGMPLLIGGGIAAALLLTSK